MWYWASRQLRNFSSAERIQANDCYKEKRSMVQKRKDEKSVKKTEEKSWVSTKAIKRQKVPEMRGDWK